VDSGVWIAHFDTSDQWHRITETILRELAEARTPLHTSDVLLFEFMTLARSRHFTISRIEEWVDAIWRTATVTCTVVEDLRLARQLITQYSAIPFSGFDASSLSVAHRLGISQVLTVDDEFIRCGRFTAVRPTLEERRAVLK
jgi:predicted nucleic acid-binding protein